MSLCPHCTERLIGQLTDALMAATSMEERASAKPEHLVDMLRPENDVEVLRYVVDALRAALEYIEHARDEVR